jgi:hypothetical protein
MRQVLWLVAGVAVAVGAVGAVWAGEGDFKPGEGWVSLFNGKDLTGWKFRGRNQSWEVEDGVLANLRQKDGKKRRGVDAFTEKTFLDFALHIEFKVPPRGNSGVYLRGRKEVQVLDSHGRKKLGQGDCGGLYGKAAPTTNACKPAGEWNAFDITIVGDTITVKLNGTTIQDKVELPGLTGGSLGGKPGTPGPIMLQGNHTTVWYRNIWIKPLPREEKK